MILDLPERGTARPLPLKDGGSPAQSTQEGDGRPSAEQRSLKHSVNKGLKVKTGNGWGLERAVRFSAESEGRGGIKLAIFGTYFY